MTVCRIFLLVASNVSRLIFVVHVNRPRLAQLTHVAVPTRRMWLRLGSWHSSLHITKSTFSAVANEFRIYWHGRAWLVATMSGIRKRKILFHIVSEPLVNKSWTCDILRSMVLVPPIFSHGICEDYRMACTLYHFFLFLSIVIVNGLLNCDILGIN